MSTYNGIEIDKNVTTSNLIICVDDIQKLLYSSGIFFGYSPFDSLFTVLLAQITLGCFLSRLLHFILSPLRQPLFVCSVLAGIILGPSGFGRNKKYMDLIFPTKEMMIFNTLSTIGASLYTFILAVKMDTSIVLRTARNAWSIGLASFIVPYISILTFSDIVEHPGSGKIVNSDNYILSSIFSTTYFPIVAHVMEELDLVTTELGRLVMTSAMLVEIISHSAMLGTIIIRSEDLMSFVSRLVTVLLPILFIFFLVKPAINRIIKRTPEGRPVKEIYVTAVMLAAMVITFVSDLSWGYILPGAFIFGAIIPDGPPLGAAIVEKYEFLTMEFFLPIFFIQVGYRANICLIENMSLLCFTFIFIAVCYLTKIAGTMVASICLNVRLENAFLLGIIMNFRGVFELSVYQSLLTKNAVSEQVYTTLVLISVFFIALVSPLIKIIYKPQSRLKNDPKTNYSRTLQSTPEDVEFHVLTTIYHEDNVNGIIRLLQAANPNAISPISADIIHVIELVGQNTPSLNPCSVYGAECKTRTSQHIIRAFSNYSKSSNGLVTIHPFTMVAPFKTMHNIICNLAEDRQIPLIIVPFIRNRLLQDFSSQLQENAPCTLVNVVKFAENNFDLVLVGKNPTNTKFEMEMVEWVENPELGVIGDMLTVNKASNRSSRNLSVLVIQHYRLPTTSFNKRSRSNADTFEDIV